MSFHSPLLLGSRTSSTTSASKNRAKFLKTPWTAGCPSRCPDFLKFTRRNPKGWFPKGVVLADVPPERKTGTRVRSDVPPERKPERGHICQNHAFTKPPFCLPVIHVPFSFLTFAPCTFKLAVSTDQRIAALLSAPKSHNRNH